MSDSLQKLSEVWDKDLTRVDHTTNPSPIRFDELTNAVTSVGPFYWYIIDFKDMSLSNVHPEIKNILGLDPKNATLQEIIDLFHPDDMEYIQNTEAFAGRFFNAHIPKTKLLQYKSSYCFRIRKKDGNYSLFNHQAMMLTTSEDGGYGQALNIHTQIDHLSSENTYLFSLIGLDGETSYMNLKVDSDVKNATGFSSKELDIIKHIANGLNSNDIAKKMFISPHTVKKHRANILRKSGFKNVAELIKNAMMQRIV